MEFIVWEHTQELKWKEAYKGKTFEDVFEENPAPQYMGEFDTLEEAVKFVEKQNHEVRELSSPIGTYYTGNVYVIEEWDGEDYKNTWDIRYPVLDKEI